MRNNNATDNGLTRRALVATAAGSALALAADPASAQRCPSPPRAKGPLVWMDMDQQELDEAYDQGVYAFNRDTIFERNAEANVRALQRIEAPQRVYYGSPEIEQVYIYRTRRPSPPTLIFIHGGAWLGGRASQSAYIAENFINAGANFVAVDFNNVTETGGDLFKMVDQCRRAVAWVYRNAASFGGSSGRIYLSGHSSGAHLAGCVLVTDWEREGLPLDMLKGALLGSGMYDLKPVRLSRRSTYVKFTDEMEQALSAQRHLDRINTPMVLTHGMLETPEFQRQSRNFAAALTAAGKSVRLLVGRGYNHFETQETLASPYGFMGRAALEMMNLAS
jgi:arylformamidase